MDEMNESDINDTTDNLIDLLSLTIFSSELDMWVEAYKLVRDGQEFPCGHIHTFDDIVRWCRNSYGDRVSDAYRTMIEMSEKERVSVYN